MEGKNTQSVNDGFPIENQINLSISNKLTYLGDLMEFLGYTDVRAVEKFCRDHKITVVRMGKKKYAVTILLDAYIQRELKYHLGYTFVDAENMLEAIENEDLTYLTRVDKTDKQNEPLVKYNKKTRSSGALNFMESVKKA